MKTESHIIVLNHTGICSILIDAAQLAQQVIAGYPDTIQDNKSVINVV
jgi:hypothetical protein